ncbi:uncharacterized protein [Typha angustifolia]|uniref:uncharacterized protein n=1 Tax=Typha angustifolia TaxID=59011 RepID=UPI003C2F0427
MQSQCLDVCGNLTLPRPPFLGFRPVQIPISFPSSSSSSSVTRVSASPRISRAISNGHGANPKRRAESIKAAKRKENIWSIDNEVAAKAALEEKPSGFRKRRKRRERKARSPGRKGRDSRVLVSGAMLVEIETVLQTQEPVIKPAWDTFASSISGIWKGVGAVFSPITAEMEPIGIGKQNENLYDCYTLSHIEKVPAEGHGSEIRRKTNWVTLNPSGETRKHATRDERNDDGDQNAGKRASNVSLDLPVYESFDLKKSDVLEEDAMAMEPGLVFFEDGSYSRGPVDLPVGEFDESKYFLSPTFQFEQCLVKGCHKRLRIVHTIEFNEGGSSIQIVRVAVYEEQWDSPINLHDGHNVPFDLKPISQRKRTQPSELTGSWKVFEVSATPIFSEPTEVDNGLPLVYLCTETLKKRSLPEASIFFGEEEMLDLQDVTVLWLPGGVTGYVDVDRDGILCIGVGWYSDEGINLVMERDYGTDGKLKEVRCKTEVKRRWNEPAAM